MRLPTTEVSLGVFSTSLQTTLGLGAALDGVELVPAPWRGQGCGSALRSLEILKEVRQWTLQMILEIDVHPSQRSSGCCHCLLTQEHICSAWRGERAAKATSGALQSCSGTQTPCSAQAQHWSLVHSRIIIIRLSGARQRRVEPEQLLSTPDTAWSPP